MSDVKKFNLKPIFEALLLVFLPWATKKILEGWQEFSEHVLEPIGIKLNVTDAQVKAVIMWIYNLIMAEENDGPEKPNFEKLKSVAGMIALQASKRDMNIIKREWGNIPQAVNYVFATVAKPAIESKKAQKLYAASQPAQTEGPKES